MTVRERRTRITWEEMRETVDRDVSMRRVRTETWEGQRGEDQVHQLFQMRTRWKC